MINSQINVNPSSVSRLANLPSAAGAFRLPAVLHQQRHLLNSNKGASHVRFIDRSQDQSSALDVVPLRAGPNARAPGPVLPWDSASPRRTFLAARSFSFREVWP